MLIRFTTPSVLGTTEYASGDEADLAPDVAHMALSLGRGVRVVVSAPDLAPAAENPVPDAEPHAAGNDAPAPDDAAMRLKRR